MPLAAGFAPTAVAVPDPSAFDLELAHQAAELGRHLRLLLRCFLSIGGSARCALGCPRHTRKVARYLAAALRHFVHIGVDKSSGTPNRRLAACPCYMLSN